MIFNSLDFAVFLPISLILYWALAKNLRLQNFFLLFASYFFYGWWDWRFLTLILFSSFVDFLVGQRIHFSLQQSTKKIYLGISLFSNLGLLGFFKYYNFFIDSFNDSFSLLGVGIQFDYLNIILPVGISFYTFQTLSYTIDIYKGELKPTSDVVSFFTFVSFFPQLVAGPIERASSLLPQFFEKRRITYDDVIFGVNKIIWGLFKKVVVADRLALFVNEVYPNQSEYAGFTLVIATIFFAFQIYCDFSGYSDIAIGTARLFGFRLLENFNLPYFSKSISEFWRRWHISLSTWFRDYVYIPLGGNKTSKSRWVFNIIAVFAVSGLWHGANWTFVAWGLLHGSWLVFENKIRLFKGRNNSVIDSMRILLTFVLVCFSWVFFRAENIGEALGILYKIFDFGNYSLDQLSFYIVPTYKNTVYALDIFLAYTLIVFLVAAEITFPKGKFMKTSPIVRTLAYAAWSLAIVLMGVYNYNEFIYFQF